MFPNSRSFFGMTTNIFIDNKLFILIDVVWLKIGSIHSSGICCCCFFQRNSCSSRKTYLLHTGCGLIFFFTFASVVVRYCILFLVAIQRGAKCFDEFNEILLLICNNSSSRSSSCTTKKDKNIESQAYRWYGYSQSREVFSIFKLFNWLSTINSIKSRKIIRPKLCDICAVGNLPETWNSKANSFCFFFVLSVSALVIALISLTSSVNFWR